MNRVTWFLLPLAIFLVGTIFLYKGLYSNPQERDSAVLTRSFPEFTLPDLMDEEVNYGNSIFQGQMTFVNVWGVWCITCAVELPYLTQLKAQGYRFVGLYYDQDLDPNYGEKTLTRVRAEVDEMLSRLGNPFEFNIFDVYRNTSLDLGVTGAPETFLVDHKGIIRVHHLGDVNERVWQQKFLPVVALIKQEMQGEESQVGLGK